MLAVRLLERRAGPDRDGMDNLKAQIVYRLAFVWREPAGLSFQPRDLPAAHLVEAFFERTRNRAHECRSRKGGAKRPVRL